MMQSNTPLGKLLRLSPHNAFLDLQLQSVVEGAATVAMPYADALVGDRATGAVHGGAIAALLDAACGTAVLVKLGAMTRIATLDLRIDDVQPALANTTLLARCRCYRLDSEIALVQGSAFYLNSEGSEIEIARAAGSFLRPLARSGASL